MKPKTKFDFEIIEHSAKLTDLLNTEISFIKNKLFNYLYTISRNRIFCLACGHKDLIENFKSYPNKKKKCSCCNRKLTYTKYYHNTVELCVNKLEVLNNFQVVRFFHCIYYTKLKKECNYFIQEVVQYWIKPDGRYNMRALLNSGFNSNFKGSLEIRASRMKKNYTKMYSQYTITKSILPVIKRNGFKPNIADLPVVKTIIGLLTNPKIETLFKAKHYYWLETEIDVINKYWPQIKICLRTNYIVSDVRIWIDYLEILIEYKKDVLNPFYVCPTDLTRAHNHWVNKKKAITRKLEFQKLKANIQKNNIDYIETKKALLDLKFVNGNITIEALKDVNSFYVYSHEFNNCLFENQYYKKEELLVFVLKKDEQAEALISYNLKYFDLIEIRGINNSDSPYKPIVKKIFKKQKHIIKTTLKQIYLA